jgi:peptide/nickel transport system permease protein
MRTSVVEVMGQDFIYYHKVTGLPYISKLKHIGKHAILPVITLYPVSMTRAISGLVLIELVFNWPGIGFALVQGVLQRDFPVVQFVFFITAAMVVIANFGVDLLYGIIDPRISVEGDDVS